MILEEPLLVTLVRLVDHIPAPPPPKQGRGHPKVYSDRLFLKALIVMMVKRLHKVYELLSVLEEATPEMQNLRTLLTQRFALGAIFLYQIALLYRFQHGLSLRVGLKAFIKAA